MDAAGLQPAADAEDMTVMRVVARETFSRDMAEILAADIVSAYRSLDGTKSERLEPAVSPRRGHHAT